MKTGSGWVHKVWWGVVLLGAASLSWASGSGVHSNPLNHDPLVREAFDHFYNLDYPGAIERFERFHAMHPGDPQGTVLLLDAVLFQELYRQDLLDTTFYANDGFLTGRHATQEDPKARDRILALADEAIHEADWRIGRNPNDVDAYYARGWARALKCTYIAMVQRGYGSGFRLAMQAKDDHMRVLQMDPQYVDAKLVVGVYEYVVGALPLPFKFVIGFAGIMGSKSRGLEMLNDDGNRGVVTNVEARTVIALFLRREARYKEAIQVVRGLKTEFPRDYLFSLEEANLRKDAGEGMVAVAAYREILAANAKPGYYASARMELTYFGLGDALRGQRHYGEAAQSYEQAAWTRNVGPELKIRSLLAAGQCHDMNGERPMAMRDYQAAIDAGPNTSRADAARKYLRSAYKGT
ncbi:MAG: tetratricopeptide repeat protein [Terracidiphilus sp.]